MSLTPTVENIPALIDRTKRDLDQARTIGEVLQIHDAAEALAAFTRKRKGLLAAHNRVMGILALCEHRIGVELAAIPKHPPDPAPKIGSAVSPIPEEPPTLAEFGLTKRQSSEFQVLAKVPETVIAEAIAKAGAEGRPAARRDYLAAAKAMQSSGVGSVEAASVEWYYRADSGRRLAEKFTKWFDDGYALMLGAGALLLERPGNMAFRVDPAQVETLANYFFQAANIVRAHKVRRRERGPRSALGVVVNLSADETPDQSA